MGRTSRKVFADTDTEVEEIDATNSEDVLNAGLSVCPASGLTAGMSQGVRASAASTGTPGSRSNLPPHRAYEMPPMGSGKEFDKVTNRNGWRGIEPPHINLMYGPKAAEKHVKKYYGINVPMAAGFDMTLVSQAKVKKEGITAEVREHTDKGSRLKTTFSIQHKILEYSEGTGLPEMVEKIPIGSAKSVAVDKDDTDYD
ncbi:hypothetical protein M436DRAFT_78205 [Aureobasidium namibiae CBS 147.97]|uniref:Uncharacterized protein n=1 Tax=Aureobasidium namibiae CBS 147.97 TaxID=1043004 RepID=A0A074WY52_9PEZI|nr:uncharacterized protein M436DRAFT_78205 [Aureobasidium namibiae CBS 147.97]KEQ76454.1 hypothetical protein M436DRAFT_78205 [Aureobasidium namibiae CBS 147.97]